MNSEKDWLEILEKATSYADLQVAFTRMTAECLSTKDNDAMVASIDEAIRRIEQERVRDQAELDGVASEYDAFKREQSGVIGWFKRKMPFTETRKQELGHRDALNDQAAEILADNFVIARAQMLKERVALPRSRRMGCEPDYWRKQFLNNESTQSIGEYGKIVLELGQTVSVAKSFVDTVRIDIDAFSSAKFMDKGDQLRSSEDFKTAQGELKALVDEFQEKVNLRTSALATLKGLLISELSEKDSDFRNTIQRLSLLKNLHDTLPRLSKMLEERLVNIKALTAKMVERDSLPEQREKLQNAILKLKRDWDEAERKRLQTVADLEGPSQLYNAAVSESQQAKAALNATKPMYEAYIAEQNSSSQNAAEMIADSNFDGSFSNVVTEYRRLEEAATAAAQRLSQRVPPYEQAKRIHDDAAGQAKTIRDKWEAQSAELNRVTKLESELQQQVQKAKQSLESSFPELRIASDSYLAVARQITWTEMSGASSRAIQAILDDHTSLSIDSMHSHGRLSTSFSTSSFSKSSFSTQGSTETQRHFENMQKAIQAIESFRKASLQEISTLASLRKEAVQRRGRLLLDQSVLAELDLD